VNRIRQLLSSLKSLLPEATHAVKETIVTLEKKIEDIVHRFQEAAEHSFRQLVSGQSRKEIIVSFLAILHLLKDKIVRAEQREQFGDIILRKPDS